MKKFYKILTAALAAAIIMASPVGTLTAHAEDAGYEAGNEGKDTNGSTDGSAASSWDNYVPSIADEQPAPAPAQPAPAQPAPAPAQPAQTVTESAPATTQSAPAKKTEKVAEPAEEVVENVVDGETFQSVMKEDHTQYDVVHNDSNVASFDVTDEDGERVAFKTVILVQGEDGLWYLNIVFAEEIDAEGLVLNLLDGDLEYLDTTLGITGIQINGKVVMLTNPKRVHIEDITFERTDILYAFEKAQEKVRNAGYLVVRGGSTSYIDVAHK